MEYTITFQPDNVRTSVSAGKSILDAAKYAGILIYAVCDARGSCGRCRVIILEGKVRGEPLRDGSYLACLTYPLSDLVVEVPPESRLSPHHRLEEFPELVGGELQGMDVGIAVDVGTTTVSACLVDLLSKKTVDYATEYNRQVSYGANVLSRINYAERSGVESLNRSIVDTINSIISNFTRKHSSINVKEIVAAGNTVMTYILMDKNPSIVRDRPQADEFRKPKIEPAEKIRLHCSGNIYTLPCVGGYVGGDVVADILFSGLHKSEKISMLIDVGTNGEVVLGNRDLMVACSTSAGPAFEGGEVGCGMPASEGAIEDVSIQGSDLTYSTIKNEKPAGICGSGLISLVAEFFSSGIIDYRGRFIDMSHPRIINSSSGISFLVVSSEETLHGREISITEKDIKKVILSKAALYAGVRSLVSVGVEFSELDKVYIAGSFGYHINLEKAVGIGLLPDIPREKFVFIGNGSLKGSVLVLINEKSRKEAEEIAKKVSYRELSGDKVFNEEYLAALYLPHSNETLFPSLEKNETKR